MIGKRVVVTGLAAITPLGNDLESSWNGLISGESGIGPITRFDCSDFSTKIAGEVKDFDPAQYIPRKQIQRMDRFNQFAVAGSRMLIDHAGLEIDPEQGTHEVGILLGCGLGGLETIEEFHTRLLKKGPSRISPFYIPKLISNIAAGQIAIATKAKGPNLVTTSACASGVHSIGYAFSDIKLGRVKAMICGGVESTITPMAVSGFNAMRALSERNDDPHRASRPFDQGRDGFVIAEGCGFLLLEELEHAKQRGATIYAEVVGFGASADAYHITAPDESGAGMAHAMQAAIAEAELDAGGVDHVNAHGTSTWWNDLCETRAIKKVFGPHASKISVTANKSMIGHALGAAGGIESVFSVMTLDRGMIPGTVNLEHPDPECDLDYVSEGSRQEQVHRVLCNSFGFGGTNACILFQGC
ncbi:beta-ketoacyl-ACP synthase II [Desulfovermiculus halophilus]|uniref:beta-ketoacyl-ACP synthase II n=1 Tax=Desulfovermiculus halophilus TaxID=339722 RepID=UPI000484B180|nr:beta-ketoacyl-ACP synthase II [Desulfovermiculus halophilus]